MRAAPGRVDDEVGGQVPAAAELDAGDVAAARDQPGHLVSFEGLDAAEPGAHRPVEQRPAERQQPRHVEPPTPSSGGQPQDVGGYADLLGTGRHERLLQAGEETFGDLQPAGPQHVQVAGLRYAGAEGRVGGEAVALDEGDAIEVVGEDAGGEQPGDAAADDDGVVALHRGTEHGAIKLLC